MEEKTPASRKWRVWIIVFAVIIVGLAAWLVYQQLHLRKLVDAREAEKIVLQHELDSLMTEHNEIKEIYGTLSDSLATKDSIIQANAKEIRKLLDTQYEYYKIRKKMAMLQKVAQGYVHQMDSLYTVNRELKEENARIRQVVRTEQGRNQELIQDKEELTQKMTQAAVLQAYGVSTTAFKVRGTKEIETNKAIRTDKLRICFTIGENSLIEAGTKILYIRITRPDNVVVTKSKYNTFEYNGQTIPYSVREDLAYTGKAMRTCVEWIKGDKEAAAMKGRYLVTVFFNDREIGQGSFSLK
ncbi:MAG: hypothetical protein ISR57_07250 [Bacteroidales bacterium]|nr:hypothetical protein [Bacteroidota bacterium]MBL6950424.1 hypothetical protein [Bacteroidales bacterium]